MEIFDDYLISVKNEINREKLKLIFNWIDLNYPKLEKKISWSQPMYTNKGTFIIAFSDSKEHLSVAPEKIALDKFNDEILKAGYSRSKEIMRIKLNQEIDYNLLSKIIDFNIKDKEGLKTFWRRKMLLFK